MAILFFMTAMFARRSIRSVVRIASRLPLFAALAVLICVLDVAGFASDPSGPLACGVALPLNGDQVSHRLAENNALRARQLHTFEAKRQYTLDYTGFPSSRSAEMDVSVAYRAPGTKEFAVISESGSKLILNRVFRKLMESEQESSRDEGSRNASALTSDNYRFILRGCEVASGRDLYV